jgi:hypothetical protein
MIVLVALVHDNLEPQLQGTRGRYPIQCKLYVDIAQHRIAPPLSWSLAQRHSHPIPSQMRTFRHCIPSVSAYDSPDTTMVTKVIGLVGSIVAVW